MKILSNNRFENKLMKIYNCVKERFNLNWLLAKQEINLTLMVKTVTILFSILNLKCQRLLQWFKMP